MSPLPAAERELIGSCSKKVVSPLAYSRACRDVMTSITCGDSSPLANSSPSVSVEGGPWWQAVGAGVVDIMVAARFESPTCSPQQATTDQVQLSKTASPPLKVQVPPSIYACSGFLIEQVIVRRGRRQPLLRKLEQCRGPKEKHRWKVCAASDNYPFEVPFLVNATGSPPTAPSNKCCN